MQSVTNNETVAPVPRLKQVKVDNWGTFFLQRLLQLYFNEELLDLNIKFHTSDNILKVHKLVITTCTDYFIQLQHEQNENTSTQDDVIFMPSDMPYECVKSIISFMYTGQLEYWTSEQDALYRTAQKMKMSVLTKLLDAQLNTNITQDLSVQNLSAKVPKLEDENTWGTLPGQRLLEKKLPVWKRKLDSQTTKIFTKHNLESCNYNIEETYPVENSGGPSRFDLPEVEELTLGVFSSFDDITYNTKPIIQAPEKFINSNKMDANISIDTMANIFEALNNDKDCMKILNQKDDSSDDDWTRSGSVLKLENGQTSPIKKVRFDFNKKETLKKFENSYSISSSFSSVDSVNNHAKIIREVLKKYPHLIQRNKNIRLKIMQKESKNTDSSTPGKTKVSYLVLKSDSLITNSFDELDKSKSINHCRAENNEIGPWICTKCNLDEQYSNYYMYRRHMQDVHSEKFDPRICEHCGYKATKRNILMYHLYTKHNVSPPKNMSFPKCHVCSYVALSEPLLIRHQISHKHRSSPLHLHKYFDTDSIQSDQCEKIFNDVTELACHKITSGHGIYNSKKKDHCCLYCGKRFIRINNLKAHIDYYHKSLQKFQNSSEIPIILEESTGAETFSHITSGVATSFSVEDELEPAEEYEHKIKNLQKCNISANEVLKNPQMVMLVNEENVQHRTSKDDHGLSISGDEIIVQNTDGNMIVYLQNTRNHSSVKNSSKNYTYENCQYSDNNDEIVEEVFEELESMEDEKEEQESNRKKLENIQITDKENKHTCGVKSFVSSADVSANSTHVRDEVQYVEEETEILEYETCTNI